MSSDDRWYKNNTDDKIWWKDTDSVGEWLFSFDKKQVFNMFADYPHNLTPEQKSLMKRILNGLISSKTGNKKSKGKEVYTFAFLLFI